MWVLHTSSIVKTNAVRQDPKWSDTKANGRFKGYRDIQKDVQKAIKKTRRGDLPKVEEIHEAMKERRSRRNVFFRSTSLLDLNVVTRSCVEAFCDLLDYGRLLFLDEWNETISSARNLHTLELVLRLEKKGFSDPSVWSKVNDLMRRMPRNHHFSKSDKMPKEGVHVTMHGEDVHFRLCLVHGGPELRGELARLL